MIIVTLDVPVMEVQYDFQIDEDVPFYYVRQEIVEMILRRNQCEVFGNPQELVLWDRQRQIRIDMERTAYENGLETGSELIMV